MAEDTEERHVCVAAASSLEPTAQSRAASDGVVPQCQRSVGGPTAARAANSPAPGNGRELSDVGIYERRDKSRVTRLLSLSCRR